MKNPTMENHKIEIDEELCKGCNICVEMCKRGVFEVSSQLNRRGYYIPVPSSPEQCNLCGLCELLCPELAIILPPRPEKRQAKGQAATPAEGLPVRAGLRREEKEAEERRERRLRHLKSLAGKTYFMQGDIAIGYGALFGGCNFFAGYPITPASEVAEIMSRELPHVGGYYIQMEDEIGSISALIGASWAGAKAMTATSGPGFSLMMENIGYAIMTETPCVIVDVQRSGPSTGQATKPAQGDFFQARWGTHGDHEMIALSPWSVQECFDLMIEAFNLAERFRHPVILLTDGEVGHMRERLRMPDPEAVKLEARRIGKGGELYFGGEDIPPMVEFGRGTFVHVTGSTHKENGMRDVQTQSVHERLITRLCGKIESRRREIYRFAEHGDPDAEVGIIAYGASARPAMGAFLKARGEGIPLKFLRLITLWPFPAEVVEDFGKGLKTLLVPEMNLGQLSREVERYASCDVVRLSRIGGVPHTVEEIYRRIRSAV
jgi:2-oxoglutarate ferredoxin oxidoreductase subunit alpha